MLRFRRYRAFLICAAILIIPLYHVSRNSGMGSHTTTTCGRERKRSILRVSQSLTLGANVRRSKGTVEDERPSPKKNTSSKYQISRRVMTSEEDMRLPAPTPAPVKWHATGDEDVSNRVDKNEHLTTPTTYAPIAVDPARKKPGPAEDDHLAVGDAPPLAAGSIRLQLRHLPRPSLTGRDQPRELFPVDEESR